MKTKRLRKGLTLRLVLSLLVLATVFLTAAVSGYAAYQANLKSLSTSYLVNNSQYAQKLSSNTGNLLNLMQTSMNSIAQLAGKQSFTEKDLEMWFTVNRQYFNSVFVTDDERKIEVTLPADAGVAAGTRLLSTASKRAVESKTPFISEPYVSTTGRLIVLVSSPIFNGDGSYAGFVGGTIYLEEENALSKLLKEHFYGNGSYVYVVDNESRLIFHPNKERIYQIISSNEVIQKALAGKNGSQKIVNSEGNEFFAGYAFEPISGWGIVSQTPTRVLEEPLEQMISNLLMQALPLLGVVLTVAWWLASWITRPLYTLARYSEESAVHGNLTVPTSPSIHSGLYEVRQLYQSINSNLNRLKAESLTDGLTGLANRKAFDLLISEWAERKVPFTLILMDVDHFKKVNDLHGHLIGDEVLKYLALTIDAFSREEDLCFRYGGEEFGILLKGCDLGRATRIAERLREKVERSKSPIAQPLTVSIGVSFSYSRDMDVKTIIEMADNALYQSKTDGRNRITIYS
ncbi:sensor domain-containing diguanylate cyclase [Paenibacillus sp. GbtcB18]|uniref:sensor domain-containing diguanylate cyclase n=1 Tax=Paenibacillus sp. GbtcB18 TaxID=2824763 RepID=UPI001C2F9ADE|nr:sensor domain-containing diguanylate cyclase [Paenibacillus sp. GbtcB18]